jgi:hypothetical protein
MADGQTYLVFAWAPTGYELREEQGEPPNVGDEVTNGDGKTWRVLKIGESPLPGDTRLCAYLQG